jgi:hypothetical protein
VPACLVRLSQHAAESDGIVLVVPDTVSPDALAPVQRAASSLAAALTIAPIPWPPPQSAGMVGSRGEMSSFTYVKPFLAEALPELDQVLYLDVDTLVRHSLTGLLRRDSSRPVSAVAEIGPLGRRLFGSTNDAYVNAGVLRMSLERWRRDEVWTRAVDVMRAFPDLPAMDQDVLNLLFRGAVDLLPATYNVFDHLTALEPRFDAFADPCVIHFVGPSKPWHASSDSRYAREWRAVDAEARGLAGLPVEPERTTFVPERGVAGGVARLRHSVIGRRVRQATPPRLKTTLLTALQRADPSHGRLWRGLMAGMIADSAAPARDTSPAGPARLVLLVSGQRSGTSALGWMMEEGFTNLHWAGEVFLGYAHPWAAGALLEQYPWILDRDRPDYASLMNEAAMPIVRGLLSGRGGVVAIKVFDGHLTSGALDDVCREFSPAVITLRRRMVFSAASRARAMATGNWNGRDSTGARVSLEDTEIEGYVVRTDAWFRSTRELVGRFGLDSIELTYEGLLEARTEVAGLRDFLIGCGAAWRGGPVETWRPPTLQQDRRTDGSLTAVFRQFGGLSDASRAALMRLPAEEPDQGSAR